MLDRLIRQNPYRNEDEEEEEEEEIDDADDADQDESGQKRSKIEPERGPRLLTRLSSDAPTCTGQAAWSVRTPSTVSTCTSPVVLYSNVWPGAQSVAWGK